MFIPSTPRLRARAPLFVSASLTATALIIGAGVFLAQPRSVEPAPVLDSAAATSAPFAGLRVLASAPIRAARPGDLTCLAKAVYYEARGESADGQAAVAQVVLNRTHRPSYPANVCAVVFQGVDQGGCQFSFACNGAMRKPIEPVAWVRARRVASSALSGHVMSAVGQAVSFHVAPLGEGRFGAIARIGGHVFFAPGGARPVHRARAMEQVAEIAPAAEDHAADASAVATAD